VTYLAVLTDTGGRVHAHYAGRVPPPVGQSLRTLCGRQALRPRPPYLPFGQVPRVARCVSCQGLFELADDR